MRKQWLSPVRKPGNSSLFSESINSKILIFIRFYFFYQAKIRQSHYM
jgi:hypothetical protein